jgi:hypothetical protein
MNILSYLYRLQVTPYTPYRVMRTNEYSRYPLAHGTYPREAEEFWDRATEY